MMDTIKVCVRIPAERKEELLELANKWRADEHGPGWDAKIIHRIAKEKFGGLQQLFEEHDWPERGSEMVGKVQRHVKETYGSIRAFADQHSD
ncbi:hypothetical protein [Sulfitobacter pontiacus]|uniref:hypothetical protein n=1 Tax=Sulfitobacter pontiacus TaxID=60137 RepID=UPI0015DDD30D|nr:hypothetical protein [Sulfitobacter pontiacus]QLL41903.1 hypothetical protein G6548_04885 [Sulfitobacter pontiacus]